jgi:hypothetical protein
MCHVNKWRKRKEGIVRVTLTIMEALWRAEARMTRLSMHAPCCSMHAPCFSMHAPCFSSKQLEDEASTQSRLAGSVRPSSMKVRPTSPEPQMEQDLVRINPSAGIASRLKARRCSLLMTCRTGLHSREDWRYPGRYAAEQSVKLGIIIPYNIQAGMWQGRAE